jgi:hypothetical protein
MALHEGMGMSADKNNACRPSAPSGELWSAERCARKIAQDETPLVVGQFTSDGDSASSIGFERGQQRHSTVYIENLRDTRHLSESHRKLVNLANKCFPESTRAGCKGVIPTPLSKQLLYLASPDTEIGWDSPKPHILFRFSNFCLRSCMSVYLGREN